MPEPLGDEFYVGYLPRAPRAIAARAHGAAAAILVVAAGLALALVAAQGRFAPAVFEYGVSREFVGVVTERPYPVLWVARPGHTADGAAASAYLLVSPGKHGAAATLRGLDARTVRLRGSLIYRGDRTMIELAPGPVEPLAAGPSSAGTPPAAEDLGPRTLVGEIVDAKCFLGVMKPGNLKPHRSCAARCISGGIPPLFAVTDATGRATYYLLATSAGDGLGRDVVDRVAEPTEITGRVRRLGDLLVLEADPSTYRRL